MNQQLTLTMLRSVNVRCLFVIWSMLSEIQCTSATCTFDKVFVGVLPVNLLQQTEKKKLAIGAYKPHPFRLSNGIFCVKRVHVWRKEVVLLTSPFYLSKSVDG